MPRLIWTEPALVDVQRLFRFLSQKSPAAARRAVAAIRGRVKILEERPGVGQVFSEADPDYRTWPVSFGDSGYVVLYRYDGGPVIGILAVRHQKEVGF